MATPTDIQFAFPSYDTEHHGFETKPESNLDRYDEGHIRLGDDEIVHSATYIDGYTIDMAGQEAFAAARSSKPESNTFNPEATYQYVEQVGKFLAGIRANEVAKQDQSTIEAVRAKAA